MSTKYEKSCGVIPFRLEKNRVKFLLVRNIGGHWEFPKGHQEKGESDRATARREFSEETGLKVKKLLVGSYIEEYSYVWKGKRKSKKVTYFLGHIFGGQAKIQEEEIIDSVWLSYSAAQKLLTYSEVRNILRSCNKELKKYLNSKR